MTEMLENQLCPNCQTGKNSYELDGNSVECPYIYRYKSKSCPFYKPLDSEENGT